MPSIRSVSFENNTISFVDSGGGLFTFSEADIPSDISTTEELDAYLNGQWIPTVKEANDISYEIVIHVFSVHPFRATAYTSEKGLEIPPEWWSE